MADFIEHHYSRPTTPAGAGFDYTILEGVEIQNETDFSASAALGEADICKVVVDDPNAVWDFAGHRRWYLAEKAISSNTLVWTGYIGQQRVHRRNADTGSNITSAGRVWELDLVELNAILSFRIITGADGNRAAETAGARLTWLLSSDYLSTVFDNGLVVYPTTAMDAVDYRGQTAADVLRDLALATGYNFFAYYDETAATDQRVSLFFDDANTSTAYTSFIRISNVLSDVESAPNNTFAPLSDAVLMRDPTNVAAGVYLPYDGGWVYDYSLTTSYNFGFRDQAAPASNVKTAAKANAILSRLLAQHDEQDDKVSCSIILPASQLNGIKHGQRMQAKFYHLPAPYNDWTWYRVLSKSFSRPENGATDRYVVDLELSPQAPQMSCAEGACAGIDLSVVRLVPFRILGTGIPGSGLVNGAYEVLAEADPGGPVFGLGRVTITLPTPPDPSNLLVLFMGASSGFSGDSMGVVTGMSPLGYVEFGGIGGGGRIGGHYGCVDGGSFTIRQIDHNFNFGAMLVQVLEIAGVNSLQSVVTDNSFYDAPSSRPGVSVTPTAGSKVAIFTIMQSFSWTHDGTAAGRFFVPKTGVTELSETDFAGANPRAYGNPGTWIGYQLAASASGSYDVNPITYEIGPTESVIRGASMTCVFECDA